MAYNPLIASSIRQKLARLTTVVERPMFGSLGFMVDNKLLVCARQDDMMVRLSSERCQQLVADGAAREVIMAGRRPKNWVTIPADPKLSDQLIDEALEYNRNLQ